MHEGRPRRVRRSQAGDRVFKFGFRQDCNPCLLGPSESYDLQLDFGTVATLRLVMNTTGANNHKERWGENHPSYSSCRTERPLTLSGGC